MESDVPSLLRSPKVDFEDGGVRLVEGVDALDRVHVGAVGECHGIGTLVENLGLKPSAGDPQGAITAPRPNSTARRRRDDSRQPRKLVRCVLMAHATPSSAMLRTQKTVLSGHGSCVDHQAVRAKPGCNGAGTAMQPVVASTRPTGMEAGRSFGIGRTALVRWNRLRAGCRVPACSQPRCR